MYMYIQTISWAALVHVHMHVHNNDLKTNLLNLTVIVSELVNNIMIG